MLSVALVTPRGRKVTDAALDPTSDGLKLWLDNDFPCPVPPGPNKYPPCSLCCWALWEGKARDATVVHL